MRRVDEIMNVCPLKHEIRVSLWEKYVRAVVGRRGLRSYLTLYAPGMMDIKHFERCGLLDFSDNVYKGVVGVTDDDDTYNDATTQGRGRPELVVGANIDHLLTNSKTVSSVSRQRFRSKFPFQVVNLDYTNSIFFKAEKDEVSLHLKALQNLVDRQWRAGADKFALFLTTTAEEGAMASHFLDELCTRVDGNLRWTEFATKFLSAYNGQTPDQLRNTNYDEFVPLGLVKFVTNLLSSNRFELVECETAVIQRSRKPKTPKKTPPHRMLHVACHVKRPQKVTLRGYGRQIHLERKITGYFDKRENGELIHLDERSDSARLKTQHAAYIQDIATDTFELQVPSPEDE